MPFSQPVIILTIELATLCCCLFGLFVEVAQVVEERPVLFFSFEDARHEGIHSFLGKFPGLDRPRGSSRRRAPRSRPLLAKICFCGSTWQTAVGGAVSFKVIPIYTTGIMATSTLLFFSSSAGMILPGGGSRLQTLGGLAAQWFDSTFSA